jgi:Na+/H+-dicarboxylate symporter
MDLTPLFDVVLGFFASALSRWGIARFMAWWVIPVVVGFLALGPRNLFTAQGEGSMLWLAFGYLFMLGCIASGVGTLLGYFLRRSLKTKT